MSSSVSSATGPVSGTAAGAAGPVAAGRSEPRASWSLSTVARAAARGGTNSACRSRPRTRRWPRARHRAPIICQGCSRAATSASSARARRGRLSRSSSSTEPTRGQEEPQREQRRSRQRAAGQGDLPRPVGARRAVRPARRRRRRAHPPGARRLAHLRGGDDHDPVAGQVGPPAQVEVIGVRGEGRFEAAEGGEDVAAHEHAGAADAENVGPGVVLALVGLADGGASGPAPAAGDGPADLPQAALVGPGGELGSGDARSRATAGRRRASAAAPGPTARRRRAAARASRGRTRLRRRRRVGPRPGRRSRRTWWPARPAARRAEHPPRPGSRRLRPGRCRCRGPGVDHHEAVGSAALPGKGLERLRQPGRAVADDEDGGDARGAGRGRDRRGGRADRSDGHR